MSVLEQIFQEAGKIGSSKSEEFNNLIEQWRKENNDYQTSREDIIELSLRRHYEEIYKHPELVRQLRYQGKHI